MSAFFYLSKAIDKIEKCFGEIFNYKKGSIVLDKLLSIKENGIILLLLKGIGDTVYGLCWVDAYKKKYPEKKITVIGNKHYEKIINAYHVDRCFFYYSDEEYSMYKSLLNSRRLSKRAMLNDIYNTDPYFLCTVQKSLHGKSVPQLLKEIIYKVDSEEMSLPLDLNCEIKSIDGFYDKAKKIIIVNPYSNSIVSSHSEYEEIIYIINNAGYTAYVNLRPGQDKIKGGIDLYCTLEELYTIAKYAAGIISVRSGILDLLAGTRIPMLVLYQNCTGKFRNLYSMEYWNRKVSTREINIDSMTQQELRENVINWINDLY